MAGEKRKSSPNKKRILIISVIVTVVIVILLLFGIGIIPLGVTTTGTNLTGSPSGNTSTTGNTSKINSNQPVYLTNVQIIENGLPFNTTWQVTFCNGVTEPSVSAGMLVNYEFNWTYNSVGQPTGCSYSISTVIVSGVRYTASPSSGVLIGSTFITVNVNFTASSSTTNLSNSTKTNSHVYSILHEFIGAPNDGANPYYTTLLQSNGVLYGMTRSGGNYTFGAYGTIFRINDNGTDYKVLYNFTTLEGIYPYGSLLLSGNTLYGMTTDGGRAYNGNNGVIFKIYINGSGYSLLHVFNLTDGANPESTLILSDNTLYGTTESGGSANEGVIFKVNINGTGYTTIHNFIGSNPLFTGNSRDGVAPIGSLMLSGNTLYGMTELGGNYDDGTIYSINLNGTGYTILHNFNGTNPYYVGVKTDGAEPYGSLTLSSGILYGMTKFGGNARAGTVFSIGTNGTDYTILHSFNGSNADYSANSNLDDGAIPYGSLTLSSGILYGMTKYGGSDGGGTIFSISTGGTGFTILHNLTGVSPDGEYPLGSLALYNNTLYGTTNTGGNYSNGVIFAYRLG